MRLESYFGVRVYRFAIAGNHIHLLVKAPNRKSFQGFLRKLSGSIAQLVTKARKGNPVGRFWDALAFSRVISWGKDFKSVNFYIQKNLIEALTGLYRTELSIVPWEKAVALQDKRPPDSRPRNGMALHLI